MSTPDRYWRARWVAVMSSICRPGWLICGAVSAGTAYSRAKACGQAMRIVPESAEDSRASILPQRRLDVLGDRRRRPAVLSSHPSGEATRTR